MSDIHEILTRLVRKIMRDTIYHRQFPCTVERQDEAGLLDLLPDDEMIRATGLQGVPIMHGIPGATVRVKPGARCLLGFQAGDPRRPFAHGWEPDGSYLESISFDEGERPLARKGDTVSVFWPTGIQVHGFLAGQELIGTLGSGPAPMLGVGIITNGNPKVRG